MRRIYYPLTAAAFAFAVVAGQAAEPRNLMLQVRVDANQAQNRQGIGLAIGTDRVGGRVYASERSGGQSSIQQVMVLEGSPARIGIGQSVLVPLHQILVGPHGTVASESVVMRDLGTGFQATPKLKGERVTIEISAYQDTPTRDPLVVDTSRLSTTLSGRLGEWIPLGGARQQQGSRQAGVVSYGTRTGESDRQLWLKVDAVP